jgi:uncharacterized protein (DUF1499 family)
MHLWSTLFAALALIVLGVLATFFIAGPERIWSLMGPTDLGPITFESLHRRSSPNDSLACPAGTCIAKSDIGSPVYGTSVDDLRIAFGKVIATETSVERVASDEATLTYRYIQRTKILRFPDTIVVRFFNLGDGRSTIALYSRSQIGRGDFGVNRARIRRWLEKLAKEVPAVASA